MGYQFSIWVMTAALLAFSGATYSEDAPDPHSMDHAMADMDMGNMPMAGMYGAYPMTREASGTSWQPESTPMLGIHGMTGEFHTMWDGAINVIYDHQGGARGGDKTFSTSMLMFMVQRPLASGTLGFRTMVSLDPLMGKNGYPLLFQTGETADGRDHLIDAQHPHDLLMELAATYSRPLSEDSSVFGYIGLPGEPALGPAAFMHRLSGVDNPEAPLTHHWLDSTHITFGVVTLGYIWKNTKLEASVFNGREPDQSRYNIEIRKLDSASVRLSYNPTPDWALQISHGYLSSPEGLEPELSIRRTTGSASYNKNWETMHWQTTAAWGRNDMGGDRKRDGLLLESELQFNATHTLFSRAERVENDELFREGETLHGAVFAIQKLTVGYIYDFYHAEHAKFGIGGLVSGYAVPSALDNVYGNSPRSYMVFFRVRVE